MKDVLKRIPLKIKFLFVFILGGIILGGLGVYAAVTIASSSVSYDNTNSGATATDVKGAIDELYDLANNKECKAGYTKGNEIYRGYECKLPPEPSPFNFGDYISLTPDKSTYTISSSITGYDSDQTITPNELTLWRVISKNDDESVDVVSEYVSSTVVYFKGTRGYANLVGGLQTIAAQYAKDGYTKSTRMMGYDGQTLTISDTSAFDGSTSIERSTTSTPTPTTGVGEEYSGGVFGDTLYLKDYTLVGNVYKSDTATYGSSGLKAYKVGTTTATAYLLSSRSYFNDNYGNVNFGSRGVSTSGILVSKDLRYFYRDMGSDEFTNYSVRPILTLKSEISIASGSGTKDSPYVLN